MASQVLEKGLDSFLELWHNGYPKAGLGKEVREEPSD